MIVEFLILLSALCFFVASLGLFRMPDPFCRIHAATKASSLGVSLGAVATAIEFGTLSSFFLAAGIISLVFLTAPMACHAVTSRLVPETRSRFTPPKKEDD